MEKVRNSNLLLEVKDFSLSFRQYKKGLHETKLQVVRNLNMCIREGEIVAIVGASGSGKSLLANAILGILPAHTIAHGELNYKGMPLTSEKQKKIRGKEIALIPQSVNALDPLMKTAKQVQSVIREGNKQKKQEEIYRQVGLPIEAGKKYPFELSGGMARRVLAATAMVSGADLIIADEPTPGLDPKALNETVAIIKQLATDGKGVMFITHDIDTALAIADKVVVFNQGETVETADVADFSGQGEKLKHPFTKALWNALPQNNFWGDDLPMATSVNTSPTAERLEVEGISYRYQKGPYLFKDLHLVVNPGKVIGIHGYSGSGKTTMAQIIAGYREAETGNVLVDGKRGKHSGMNPVQLIWQHPEKAINPRWQMKKVLEECGMLDNELLSELGIKQEWLTRYPSELSGGELQRFCVARALHPSVKYIIADEITTMLDAITQAKLWEMIVKHARMRNIGVLVISHDRKLLNKVCDRQIKFGDITNV